MRGPLLDLLFAGAEVRTILAVATVGTALAILVAAAHHRRRALLMFIDLDGEEADDILVDVRLALELGDRSGRRVDVEHHVMRLAVLRDAISEAAKAPGLRLGDLPAIVFDDLGGVFRERIDLGLCEVLAREENMLVERHVLLLSFGRSLTPPSATPLRLSSKKHWGTGDACTPSAR